MTSLLLIWLGLLGVCLAMAWRQYGSGTLLLAYFIGLSLVHVPGAYIFTGSAPGLGGREETITGFQITLVALAALLAGAALARAFGTGFGHLPGKVAPLANAGSAGLVGVSRPMLFVGAGVYFVALPVAGLVPSLTSVISSLATMIIIALWIFIHNAIVHRDYKLLIFPALAVPILPFSTLFFGGFIGFGISWLIAIFAFYFVQARLAQKLAILAAAPVVLSLGLSFGNAYFAQREQVREAVWYENAPPAERLDSIFGMADKFELFDLENRGHVEYINLRLNQNFLLGTGVGRHRTGMIGLEYGGTIPLWSLVPRVIWPSKPEVGGGRDVVEKFAGVRFNASTSVGAGQPLEFYANFGLAGVIVGMLLWGALIAFYDGALARGFRAENFRSIIKYGLPGLTLLQPGGNLLEILIALIGAIIMVRPATWLLVRSIDAQRRKRHLAQTQTVARVV